MDRVRTYWSHRRGVLSGEMLCNSDVTVVCYVSDDLSSLSSPDVEQLSSQTKPL